MLQLRLARQVHDQLLRLNLLDPGASIALTSRSDLVKSHTGGNLRVLSELLRRLMTHILGHVSGLIGWLEVLLRHVDTLQLLSLIQK